VRQKRYSIATACLLALISVVSCFGAATANAQSTTDNTPSGGLRITPAITQTKLQPGQNTLSLEYTVSNLTNQALTVTLGTRDFGAFSQNGSITLFGAGYNPTSNPHGIQSYASFPDPTVTVPANSSQQVAVSIQNATKLAPGGHYGAVLFSPQSAFAATTNNNHVNVNTSIAGLVFLTTAYGGTYGVGASISHISPVQFKLPSSVYLVFDNTGNTQTIPQGQLTIEDPHANVLSTQVVNSSSGLILSGGSRIFQIQLPPKDTWGTLTGVYHLKLQYKDSEDTSYKTLNQSFLYINWKLTILIVSVLIIVLYTIKRFVWRLLKRLASFRFKKRTQKSTAASGTTNTPNSKVMDVVNPKQTKKQ
jgi:hypothetical protein